MINFSSCDKHADCLVVFDNVDGCPVCKMIEEITDIIDSKFKRSETVREKLDEIKEKLK